jgi:biotin transporter BioY
MDSNTYIVGSCIIAALSGGIALLRNRPLLALLLAMLGPCFVLGVPIMMMLAQDRNTPGLTMIWLLVGPIALFYMALVAILVHRLPDHSRKQQS